MSSIWSTTGAQNGNSPFAGGVAPTPGGGKAAKYQSMLQSKGAARSVPPTSSGTAKQATQLGLSSKAGLPAAAANSANSANAAGSADPSDSASSITANDFLTLLVTEMQNQDPTADTDPNEYINQLVQINSLEQLISINQNLAAVLGAAAPSSTSSQDASKFGAVTETHATGASSTGRGGNPAQSGAGSSAPASAQAPRGPVNGNLGLPQDKPAAQTVAHALDGRPVAVRRGHAFRDIPTH